MSVSEVLAVYEDEQEPLLQEMLPEPLAIDVERLYVEGGGGVTRTVKLAVGLPVAP